MTVSPRQVADYTSLRRLGATVSEAAEVLLTVAESDRQKHTVELILAGASPAEAAYVVDLVSDAWVHEPRGKGGQWARSPLAGPMAAARAVGAKSSPSVAARKSAHATVGQVAHVQQQAVVAAQEAAAHHAKVEVHKMMAEVKQAHEEFVKAQDTQEGHKARLKFAGVIGTLIGGAALSLIEAKLGVPDVLQAVSAITPATAEAMFELKKRL